MACLGFGKGGHGERAEREPTTRVWGRSPQRGPGAEPLVGRSGGRRAETLFASKCSMETANSPIFLKFGNAIDHQTLLNFAILAGKWQKRTFSYKVASKNFYGRTKGGHRTVALPLNTPLACIMKNCNCSAVDTNHYVYRNLQATEIYTLRSL